jgi:hypothetical protein
MQKEKSLEADVHNQETAADSENKLCGAGKTACKQLMKMAGWNV